jgi:hypothetical protein
MLLAALLMVHSVSHKFMTIGELLFGKIQRKCKEGEVVAADAFPVSGAGIILPGTSRYGAVFFTLSKVKR